MEPRSVERGNQPVDDCSADSRKSASMEPRSVERGNTATQSSQHRARQELQWSHAQSNVETTLVERLRPQRMSSFNGATLSRTWKRESLTQSRISATMLQWSHAQSNVETMRRDRQRRSTRTRASMEPRSVERGNAASAADSCTVATGFNGATLSRTWKRRRLQ